MKAYYGSRFSPNMTMTPEGFLVCHNVPIARTGWYEYLRKEIGADGDPNEIVKVYRSPEEVFSPAAMASFEGKPTTDEHPSDWVTPDNISIYGKGAAQNIRKSQKEPDLLLADLMIYDANLITEIQDGKREVSCGYDCVYEENEDGTYSQRQICGNHVAVVHAGRAGNRVAIKDSKIAEKKEGEKRKMADSKLKLPIKKHSKVTDILASLGLKHFAQDAEPEEIMDAVNAMAEEKGEVKEKDEDPGKTEKEVKDEEEKTPENKSLEAKVDKLTEIVAKLAEKDNKANGELKPEDAIDAAIDELEIPQAEANEDEIAEMCAKICSEMAEGGEISQDQITNICTQVCMQVASQMGSSVTSDESSEESVTVDPEMITDEEVPIASEEEKPKKAITNTDNAYKLQALRAMKPVIAAITDPAAKKKACDSLISSIKRKPAHRKNTYASILKGQRKTVKKAQNKDTKTKDYSQLGKDIAKKWNPHYKENK